MDVRMYISQLMCVSRDGGMSQGVGGMFTIREGCVLVLAGMDGGWVLTRSRRSSWSVTHIIITNDFPGSHLMQVQPPNAQLYIPVL